ncbi:MAG: GTP-binding protein YchF [Microgenomates group bacterium GW2011_GWF2_47_9]|nr:MAG: GTP-binding protein YchF [Microgenomates group bacterium GW2011_GWF2_47_9]
MSLSVGIVGLPNVGKSTLFNALLSRQQAYVANYPFATIEPNVGVVPVPDKRLGVLAGVVKTEKIVPATVTFNDIAGIIKGASQGEGLGNKFLAHIRETSLILHVLRVFEDGGIVKEGSVDPKSDFETVKLELELADLEMIEKQTQKSRVKNQKLPEAPELPLFGKKPSMIAINVGEGDLVRANELEREYAQILEVPEESVVAISAKVEDQLSDLPEKERLEYLSELGINESGLSRLVERAYHTLGLISFLTAGEKEVRAWTVEAGTMAPQAAGVIHSDFEKKFISARVTNYDDFVQFAGWKGCLQAGKVRQEGREYVMQEGDVVEFMIGS